MSALLALKGTVMLAGAGKMGGALLEGWLKAGLPAARVAVRDPSPPKEIAELLSANKIALNENPKGEVAALIIAVKPQVAPDVLPPLSAFASAVSNPCRMTLAAVKAAASVCHSGGLARLPVMPSASTTTGGGLSPREPGRNMGCNSHSAPSPLSAVLPAIWKLSRVRLAYVDAFPTCP